MLPSSVLSSLRGWKLGLVLIEEKGSGLEIKTELCWQNHEKIGRGMLKLCRPEDVYWQSIL